MNVNICQLNDYCPFHFLESEKIIDEVIGEIGVCNIVKNICEFQQKYVVVLVGPLVLVNHVSENKFAPRYFLYLCFCRRLWWQ